MRFHRDWRDGASLKLRKGRLILQCDYDVDLIAALKKAIPSRERSWNPKHKAWIIARRHERLVIRLIRKHLGELVRTQKEHAARGSPASTQEETLYQVRFSGVCAGVIVRRWSIVQTAPILRRFLGQSWDKLRRWVLAQEGGQVVLVLRWRDDELQ